MTEDQKQVLLSGKLGDGGFHKNGSTNHYFATCSKHIEYIAYKLRFMNGLINVDSWYQKGVSGYTGKPIHRMVTKTLSIFNEYKYMTLKEALCKLNDFGLALWFYDDGSLHKSKYFYNLNTQDFSYQDNIIIKDFLESKYNIKCQISKDREYWYIRINKLSGASVINNILLQYPIPCYSYKTTSPDNFTEVRNLSSGKQVIVSGVTYACIKDAAEALGIPRDGLTRAFRLGRDSHKGYDISKV